MAKSCRARNFLPLTQSMVPFCVQKRILLQKTKHAKLKAGINKETTISICIRLHK
jgi:hypothetical protein